MAGESGESRITTEDTGVMLSRLVREMDELRSAHEALRIRASALEEANADLGSIQAAVNEGIVVVDHELRVRRITPLAGRLLGLPDDHVGRGLLDSQVAAGIDGLEAAIREALSDGGRRTVHFPENSTSYLITVHPYRSPTVGEGAVITLTDVTEVDSLRRTAESALSALQRKSLQLAQRSAIDTVTGLFNRRHFTDALDLELSRASRTNGRLALAWIDLDHFKEINDEHGHTLGDDTLRVVGERLASVIRPTDVVGRMGGDEFAVIVSGYSHASELDQILDDMLDALRQPVAIDGRTARVTASIGVALCPDDDTAPDGLIRGAVAAMHAVKGDHGDNYGYFDAAMNAAADERRSARLAIARAIDDSEFELHYQPIVDASLDSVWGVEALVRWRHQGELIPARDFISLSEETGQIRAVGMVTLDQLRQDLRTLRESGYEHLRYAVNLSVSQLEDPRFIELMQSWEVPDSLKGIAVEIVESVFLPDHSLALEVVHELARRGADISIDDYGSGYSNIRLLETLAPTYIKLDRTFLSERHGREARAALVRSAVEVSHVIGAQVIAEGIEDLAQCEFLRDVGVDFVQGCAIAGPMQREDLVDWLTAR